MICPHCGYSLDDGVAFCIYCGTRFGKYATGEMPPIIEEGSADPAAAGKHAAPAADGSAVNAAGEPVPESAWQLVGDYPEGAAAGAAAAGAAVPNIPGVQPVPAGADDAQRLHGNDAISQAMSQIPDEPERKSRKGLGAVIGGLAVVAVLAAGAAYVVPTLTSDGGSSSSTASTASTDSSAADASSSSTASASSSSTTPDTKRGSTLSNATHADEQQQADAAAQEAQTVDDSGAVYYDSSPYANGGTGTVSGSSDAGAYNGSPTYTVFTNPKAQATSISKAEGSANYGPEMAIDGRSNTAWNTNFSGVNQSITILSDTTDTVHGLRIMNGYNATSSKGEDLYWANARAKTIFVEYEGGSFEYTLADSKGTYQDVPIDPAANTWWVKFTIKSEYPGNNYEDCCISEVQVY